MPKSSRSKLKPQQLLIEGNSDKQVIKALCESHEILTLFSFTFPTQGGVENLLKNLPIKLKVFIHSWLALQKKPGMPMGQAITAKALAYDSAIAFQFISWLKNLFVLSESLAE
ncbi:MAG: DUF3226 domain-containing protein [Cyanobacteria bacterium J06607_15]